MSMAVADNLYWGADSSIATFFRFALLYNNIVPISLFIVLDIIRLV
jgi:hypothetical protein